MPTADSPLVQPGGEGPSQIWWRFWFALLRRTLQTVQATVNDAVTAAGTTQGTATQLESEWNVVISIPTGGGVILDGFNIGVSTTVFNRVADVLKIYPPHGMQIDALGTNNPYSLNGASGPVMQIFSQVSATQFYSTKLG